MTFTLTTSHKRFIQRMTENEEQERKGYELLLKKDFYFEFFDAITAAALFAPERSPGIVPAKVEGYVQVPYWAPLDYLEACARYSGIHNDTKLANKVVQVVRAVSAIRDENNQPRFNYHTNRKFAEILGLVPPEIVTIDDIDLIPTWLLDPYDRGMVSHALDKGMMAGMLNSANPADWDKALKALSHCTAITTNEKRTRKSTLENEVTTLVDDYWLKDLIDNHSAAFGEKNGERAAQLFYARLEEIFGTGTRRQLSYLFRPAIEKHEQNHQWHGPENRFVEGLRDVLLAWVNSNTGQAKTYIATLLQSKLEIARRVTIYVIDEKWEFLSDIFTQSINPDIFESGHLHELYWLLNHHFAKMDAATQNIVLEAINGLPIPPKVEDKDYYQKSVQRKWLSAIVDKGNANADEWYAALNKQLKTTLLEHPDFHSYVESSWGKGTSPYPLQSLIEFADDLTLIEKLNSFEQTDRWRGPTTHALVDALTEAVVVNPEKFTSILLDFLNAKRPYQYGLVAGMKRLWDKDTVEKGLVNWDIVWPKLFDFFEQLLSNEFWDEELVTDQDWTPNRDWIAPVVADLLRAGTISDEHAYHADLLPLAQILLQLMLVKATSIIEPQLDAMTQAINTTKGKVIEAWFSFALRSCRIADKTNGKHEQVWDSLQPVFDQELAKCTDSNFEFSTLTASYLSQFEYMNLGWLKANLKKIFPLDYPANFNAAISGLAYSQPTKNGYESLVEAGVIEEALSKYDGKRQFEERLVERVALAYLWDLETLDSPRFKYLFETPDIEGLEIISRFFWSVSGEKLEDKVVEAIMQFWIKCVEWAAIQKDPPVTLLSNLSVLACYLKEINAKEKELLMAVAPYSNANYNANRLIEYLDRLADVSPQNVGDILESLLNAFQPMFDFEDHSKSILRKLAQHNLRTKALALTDKLRMLNGMPELFEELSHPAAQK